MFEGNDNQINEKQYMENMSAKTCESERKLVARRFKTCMDII